MQETLELAKYVVPSIVVLITSYFLLKIFLNSQEEIKKKELQTKIEELRLQVKQKNKKHIIPIRLQAYERMVLFLERISPQSLIFRVQAPGQRVAQLQADLLRAIRDEYEHNLAQQLYISKDSWTVLKAAKEETIELINNAASTIKPEDDSIELSKRIFETSVNAGRLNNERAIELLKRDVQNLF